MILLVTSIALLVVSLTQGSFVDQTFIDIYFQNIFTLFILVDVLILMVSLVIIDDYEVIFLNASLLISSIIVRFAFTAEFPFNNIVPFIGMLFGLITIWTFYFDVKNRY